MAPVAKETSYRVYDDFDVDVVSILNKCIALQPLRKIIT